MGRVKVVFLDLDGTVWNHSDISSLIPPFRVVNDDVIKDRAGVEVRLREGVREFLRFARELGLVVAALSWNDPEIALEALKAFKLVNHFDRLYIEPHPHKGLVMLRAIKELGVEPEEVIYVDDRDIHLSEVRELVGNVKFVQFGKDVKGFEELRGLLKDLIKNS